MTYSYTQILGFLVLLQASWLVSREIIRWIADVWKVRLFIQLKAGDLSLKKFIKSMHIEGRTHVHHYIYGIILAVAAVGILLLGEIYLSAILLGTAIALVISESKELLLQKWGK